jgi:glycosyltransferase involved in cell wall biosynthesis
LYRVCLIITGLSVGGAEIMLTKLLENIDRSQFSPMVVSLTTADEVGPRIQALGIPVYALGMKQGKLNFTKFVRMVRMLRQLRPNVVHTWMYHADLLGGLAARLAGIRSVSWGLRQSNLSPEVNKRVTLIVVKICAYVSWYLPLRILSCSERGMKSHTDAGYCAHKMVLIPNGFDLTRFYPDANARESVRYELGLVSGTMIVGLVARDDPQKNLPGFIAAAARVHAALPQVHFIMVGTGIDGKNDALNALIKHSNLQKVFHLLGRRHDIPRLMASMDLLVSSSIGEAFPNVIGEAMSCGVPCVVTDVGDAAEVVGDTGRVVDSSDMGGVAQHLINLLQWPTERRVQLGARARSRIQDRYEIGGVTRLYEKFYIRLMKEI